MTQTFINNYDNKRLAIYQSSGNGQPVLFIHGNSLGGELYSRQLNSNFGEKFRCVAFDFPGHGNSDTPSDPEEAYAPQGLMNSLAHVINEMKLHNAILVGNSLGGHLIFQIVEQFSEIKGIVVFGTPPLTISPDPAKVFLPNPIISYFFKGVLSGEETTQLCAAIVSPGAKTDAEIIRLLKKTDGKFRSVFAASAFAGGLKDETEIVSKLNIPIAIFHGENEQLINLAYLRSLTMPTLWNNQVQLIENASHCPHWENAEAFNALLEKFIEEICTKQ